MPSVHGMMSSGDRVYKITDKNLQATEEFLLDKMERLNQDVQRIYVPYYAVLNGHYADNEKVVPVIPNVTKGWHDENIRRNFDKILAVSKQKGIAVGNLSWVEPFVSVGINVFGDYGLNLYNSMDFLMAKEIGIKEAVIS